MDPALFAVSFADLEYGDRDFDEEIPVDWLASSFAGSDATATGPGHLAVTVSKSGREVMVRGHARAPVTLPCARTLDPSAYILDAEVFLTLEPRSVTARRSPVTARSPKGGQSRRDRKRGEEEEARLLDQDAARDTFDGEKVVLDRFIREFLLLEVPMVPLREDLRSEATPAIERPPETGPETRSEREGIDPRLAPLLAIASKLRDKKE